MSDLVKAITDQTFEAEVIKSDIPVLLKFWATWCGPCKMIAPILEEVALLYQGRVKFVKMDIDRHEKTTAKYAVRSVPTLMLFKNGQVVETKLGALAKTQLASFIDACL